MIRIKIVLLGILLISLSANGQETVRVFQGRRVPFKSQKILDLSYSNLKEVPLVAQNSDIEILILDNNNLEKLPSWIGNLSNLKVLSVRNNNLSELDSRISFCENLEQLYLSGNKNLAEIPGLSFCEKLVILDVTDTMIDEVPGWVKLSDSLYYFKFTERKKSQ